MRTAWARIARPLLLSVLLLGCDAAPPPAHNSSQDLLARRRQARALVEVAEAARARQDDAGAAAAYGQLLALWPDFPEAQPGGEWSGARARAAQRVVRVRDVHLSLLRGQWLEAQLRDRGQDLQQMQRTIQELLESP